MLVLGFLLSSVSVEAEVTFSGISIPVTADRGQPIPVSVNIVSDTEVYNVEVHYERENWVVPVSQNLTLVNGTRTNGTWAGEIPAQEWGGELTVNSITADDAIHTIDLTIEIEGAESGFPWKWVIIGAFLVVVFIATELAFKPGFYRPTGRERARALEEEDRRKAQEEAEKTESENRENDESPKVT